VTSGSLTFIITRLRTPVVLTVRSTIMSCRLMVALFGSRTDILCVDTSPVSSSRECASEVRPAPTDESTHARVTCAPHARAIYAVARALVWGLILYRGGPRLRV